MIIRNEACNKRATVKVIEDKYLELVLPEAGNWMLWQTVVYP
jgi:hypothetical protein